MTQTLPMLFNVVEAIDFKKHKNLKFNAVDDFSHVKDTHFVQTVLGEVPHLTNTYPIAFAPTEGENVILVAVLGMEKNKNGYLDSENKWMAQYVPAYVQKYPFIGVRVSDSKEDERVLCLDTEAQHFKSTKGQALFDKDGNLSELVKENLRMVEEYTFSEGQTREFCKDIQSANILEDWQENSEYGSISFKRINVNAFQNLSEEKISEWHKKGYLTSILNIVQSQRSWRELDARLSVMKNEEKAK